jgi:hypothetical protein
MKSCRSKIDWFIYQISWAITCMTIFEMTVPLEQRKTASDAGSRVAGRPCRATSTVVKCPDCYVYAIRLVGKRSKTWQAEVNLFLISLKKRDLKLTHNVAWLEIFWRPDHLGEYKFFTGVYSFNFTRQNYIIPLFSKFIKSGFKHSWRCFRKAVYAAKFYI